MFNLGTGEVVVMALLAILFLGRARLSELSRLASRWSSSEWVLVLAAALTGALALALLTAPTR